MKIGIVTPWFAENLTGGAERLAWELAFGLRDRIESVSVFTTCARSFDRPWNENYYKPGRAEVNGVSVHRFLVDRTDSRRFTEINRKLLAANHAGLKTGVNVLDEVESNDFIANNINSTSMLTHLARVGDELDAVLFLPYMYGTTLRGWRVVKDRAVLIPCLHDEVYAYLRPVEQMMRGTAGIFFNSEGAHALASRIFGPGILPRAHVVGAGVPPLAESVTAAQGPIGNFTPEHQHYLLYLGRAAAEKNTDFLINAFRSYKALVPGSKIKLVLAGTATEYFGDAANDIISLGHVSENGKARLLKACLALAQPSRNESFSRVMIEAWNAGRPVLVHADCDAMAIPLSRTGAGWQAQDLSEWVSRLDVLDRATPEQLNEIGARGRSYAREFGSWPNVLSRYEAALASVLERRLPTAKRQGQPIIQRLGKATYAGSVTTTALQMDRALQRAGYEASVIADVCDTRLGYQVRPANGTPAAAAIVMEYSFENSKLCVAASGHKPLAFPMFPDLDAWNIEPAWKVMCPLQDGRTNILSVAKISRECRTLDLIEIFVQYFALDYNARLLLVGPADDDKYRAEVEHLIESSALEHRVVLAGEISRPALAAFYRSAHIFVSLRQRYKTGLSLLEAMAFGIPLCLLDCDDARAVVKGAGLLFPGAMQRAEVAGLWRLVVVDKELNQKVVCAQRKRVAEATAERAVEALKPLLQPQSAAVLA